MRIIETLIWLLPATTLKNKLLRRFGHDVAATARIGPNLVVGVARAEIGPGTVMGPFNTVKGLSLFVLSEDSGIGSWNWISAHPAYQAVDPQAGTLALGYGARIESRSYIDCSGTIQVGAYSAIGGQRCLLQSHEPNIREMIQTVGRIEVGHHTTVGSNVVILAGAVVPAQSVLAANSTMTGKPIPDPKPGVYGGTPARFLVPITGSWFEREQIHMTEIEIKVRMGVDRSALDVGRNPSQIASDGVSSPHNGT